MYPLLFEIPIFGGLKIYTYGVLVALGFVIGIAWIVREGKIAGIHPDKILDLSFYLILAGLAGSRVLYIITDWERYAARPVDVFKIWEGGLVYYGGFIAALVTGFFYVRKKGLSFLKVTDCYMPGLAIGHGIGRIGCFMAGCCYGRETHGFLHVIFPPDPHTLAPVGVPLIPIQLIETAVETLIFLMLVFVRRKKTFDGEVFLVYLILYSVARSVLEIFRGDAVRGYVIPGWLSTSQFISACLVIFAAVLYYRLKVKKTSGRMA
jgi:phosphatidylglycerol:prolipoprotein diacylglycerol transferase